MGQFHESVEERYKAWRKSIGDVWADTDFLEERIKHLAIHYYAKTGKFFEFIEYVEKAVEDPYILAFTKAILLQEKEYFLSYVEQSIPEMMKLIVESRELFEIIRSSNMPMSKDIQTMNDDIDNLELADKTMTKLEKLAAKYEKQNAAILKRFESQKVEFMEKEKHFETLKK